MLPIFDNAFWSAFWPGTFSTLIGVVIGVPVGLLVVRETQRTQEGSARRSERDRLTAALQTIREAIGANRAQLVTLVGLTTGHVVTAPVLNAVAWDAVRLDVVSFLREPELQAALADYFVQIEDVRGLNDRYLDMSIGVTSALSSASTNRDTLRTHLIARSEKVASIGDDLIKRLDRVIEEKQ